MKKSYDNRIIMLKVHNEDYSLSIVREHQFSLQSEEQRINLIYSFFKALQRSMANKMHTREKKRRGLATHKAHTWSKSLVKVHREKTFKTEAVARKWAQEQGIKEFDLVPVKREKRLAVRPKGQ